MLKSRMVRTIGKATHEMNQKGLKAGQIVNILDCVVWDKGRAEAETSSGTANVTPRVTPQNGGGEMRRVLFVWCEWLDLRTDAGPAVLGAPGKEDEK
jgi:hypothetical protein